MGFHRCIIPKRNLKGISESTEKKLIFMALRWWRRQSMPFSHELASSRSAELQMAIPIGARASPLSQAQVQEVLRELQCTYPYVRFIPHYVKTLGDRDQSISLRNLPKTDLFTKEIDELVWMGQCRLGIHSAKDLADPLRQGLESSVSREDWTRPMRSFSDPRGSR